MYVCMYVYVLKEGVVGVQVVSLVCERSRCPCVIATYMDYMMDVLPTTCRQQTRQQLKSETKKRKCTQVAQGTQLCTVFVVEQVRVLKDVLRRCM